MSRKKPKDVDDVTEDKEVEQERQREAQTEEDVEKGIAANANDGTSNDPSNPNVELFKVEVLDSDTVINCHELKAGTVVELTEEEIRMHRMHGLRLGDVAKDDDREVFDLSQSASVDNG